MSNVHNLSSSCTNSGVDLLQNEWKEFNRFHFSGEYPCPVCRHGKVTEMPMMETFACGFCQHIFTTNFDKQLLKMADSQLPLTWYWNGKNWKGIHRDGAEIGWFHLLFALCFICIPTCLVAVGIYLFPPVEGSTLAWFPFAWAALTFGAHLFCVVWLIIEYYQFPIFLYLKALIKKASSSKLLGNLVT